MAPVEYVVFGEVGSRRKNEYSESEWMSSSRG